MPNIKDGAPGYPIGNQDNSRRGRGRRKKKRGCLWVMILVVSVAVASLSWANRDTEAATLRPAMVHCDQEDGSGDQAYPCVWDARTQGNGMWGEDYPPVLVYVTTECPRVPEVARCFRVTDWLTR